MYEVKYVYRRPNLEVEQYDFPQEFLEYVWEHYSETRLFNDKQLSDDGLEFTQSTFWVSKEAFDMYQADPVIQGYLDKKRQHSQANGISFTVTYREL